MLWAALRATALSVGALSVTALVQGPWSDAGLSPDQRAALLANNLTLDEKLLLLHGPPSAQDPRCKGSTACDYVGNVFPIPRLGLPPINMNDGPQGFRDPQGKHPGTSTAWPSGLTIAASWDVDALYEWGAGMGKEFYAKGANVQLGPGVCIARVPRNGRNFEYLSGEDPYLGKTLVQPAIRGIQSQKVVANAKHFVLNNQETARQSVSEEADERTRFEIYYQPFEGAVDADVGSFMCSYNKISGTWSCENPVTLAGDLKTTLGFKGYVMSDWGATHSASIMAGLDVEMPGAQYLNPEMLKLAMEAGTVTLDKIDDSVRRILRSMFAVGVMDEPASAWDSAKLQENVTTAASAASARRLSAISTVLLKNDGAMLPLPRGKKLALLGFAGSNAIVGGGGSGSVSPSYIATPLEGVSAAAGSGADVTFADGSDIAAASALAAAADYAIVFVGTLSSEGSDRASLSLDDGCDHCKGNPKQQNALVAAVAKANKKTVVVASVPGAVLMPWTKDVPAILTNFMPGQQTGNAIADVLFGDVNPSGKLPITFPNVENEIELSQAQWPGIPKPENPTYAYYTEKLLVGYRFYDARGIDFSTGFPFGHGLSYSDFHYRDLSIRGSTVSCTVENRGKVAGAEVVQLYLGFPQAAGEPPLQLRGFKKTAVIGAGESQAVELALTPRDFSVWDSALHRWSIVDGTFQIKVGSSSRDIRLEGTTSSRSALPLSIHI